MWTETNMLVFEHDSPPLKYSELSPRGPTYLVLNLCHFGCLFHLPISAANLTQAKRGQRLWSTAAVRHQSGLLCVWCVT